ncbi:hypothetical protein BCR44DRAFT_310277 [Catenaria anguillulae PL171]|uniref:Uncharacterized protein n=1 Tax=Catenaria anguillulae PL171 TaxID=765915 RepID=A0A1Y2HUK9_9FUNG|nr:hypothetical protein BCR44DRAFT_310277 [Catenaria anguillulae PL171]
MRMTMDSVQLDSPAAMLASLPSDILDAIAQRIVHDHHRPAADLAALALTCSAIARAANQALYKTLVVPNLTSLPLLDRTLSAHADLAAQVKVLVLGLTFPDTTQFDLSAGLSDIIKSADGIAVANEDRIPLVIGKDTPRAMLMAWMTHIARVCPNLVGVDFSRVYSLSTSHVLGFTNLAQVIGPRKGWFKSPAKGDFYLAGVAVHDSAGSDVDCKRRKLGLVNSIDWGKRTISIFGSFLDGQALFLSQLHDLIPGSDQELAKWCVGRVMSFEEPDSADYSQVLPYVYGVPADSPAFDITPNRLSKSSTYSISTSTLARASKIRSRAVASCTALALVTTVGSERAVAESFSALPVAAQQKQFYSFLRHLVPLKASPWTTVALLALGTPLFSADNWLDSLNQLASIAKAFPNVTSLTLRSFYPAIADVLLACDPFLRRPAAHGRPLRELDIFRHSSEPKLPELKFLPSQSNLDRTQLNMTRASPFHLSRLGLLDAGMFNWPSTSRPCPILIHPGLLHSIKHINVIGTVLAVAPSRLASPDALSFPSILTLRESEPVLHLGNVSLPNMETLAVNANLLVSHSQPIDDLALARVLPSCPNLEMLTIDMKTSLRLKSWLAAANVIKKYPRVRSVYLASVSLDRAGLLALADHFFAHPVRELRPVPILGRVFLVNESTHAPDVTGLWVAGPETGTVWMSDVKVPGEFKVVSPCPLKRIFGSDQVQDMPGTGEACLCPRGWVMMGRPGAWIHPMDGTVVCAKCCGRVGKELKSSKGGVVVRRVTKDAAHFPMFMYQTLAHSMAM